MGNPRAFLTVPRRSEEERSTSERVKDWQEVAIPLGDTVVAEQASRCMDCGIPFCHAACPLGNLIPEWNDLLHRGDLDAALGRLYETNNFPEITSRVCPAPCEASCVLGMENAPVAIKAVERRLAEHARASGFLPRSVGARSPFHVAVVGSGPAGLAAAQELARLGHAVTVLEKDDRIGGLLRYGIPDFKLERAVLDERLAQMSAEGVVFQTNVHVGVLPTGAALLEKFDALVLATGARAPRTLDIPGASLPGVHLAMDFLVQQNRRVAGDVVDDAILTTGKDVVVLGGGDTGADCVGTAVRQGAKSVLQLELMEKPPLVRAPFNPWPEWPLVLRSSTSHDEGCLRDWAVSTRAIHGVSGKVSHLEVVRVERRDGKLADVGGAFTIPCDIVLLAMGFVGPEADGLVMEMGLLRDARGNVTTSREGATNVARVFATGDMSRGQSLVVWAIADGRRVARGVDASLRRAREARVY
jgi:glutamate synthase (NADPH/NADH) small chain